MSANNANNKHDRAKETEKEREREGGRKREREAKLRRKLYIIMEACRELLESYGFMSKATQLADLVGQILGWHLLLGHKLAATTACRRPDR